MKILVNNDLVKVHKDFTKLNIGTLSEKELELFYYICLNVKDIRDEIITMDFSSIKKSLGLINFRDLKKYILGLHQKLGNLHITNITNKKIETIFLFEKFINDLDNNTLTIRVTKDSLYFFNIANSYLRFLFSDVRKLSGKYSKLLVPYLMEFSHKKEAEFEKERFFNILEVEESYRNNLSDFNKRILKPAVEELKTLFENLKVERLKNGRVIKGYKFSWTNDFNFQNKKDNIEEAEVVEEKENIASGELEKYFKSTFTDVNYSKKHKEVLEKLLKNNSLEYIKKYLSEQWEYVQNDKNILNKSAYFSKLILEEKAVYKNHLPADYEELKVEERNRNIESTNTITSLKDLVEKDITDYEVRKNITPEQIEQEVLFKIDVTEEEYNKIKEDWIIKRKDEVPNSDPKLLEIIFNASQSKKYNIINTKEEVNEKEKELHELEENIKRMQEELNKLKKEV
ncbi:replication protein rep [Fusobacterium nucleatum]|uniref:Replication protein rep n=2 Tax=Fusobacterium nucleatum TaxID=851 RepID=A0A323TU64_FUSNU|nr:replication protein rep [Fusobacterium nucleatum]